MAALTGQCMGCRVRGALVGVRIIGCRCRTVAGPKTIAPARTPRKSSPDVPARARCRGRRRTGNLAVAALVAGLAARGYPELRALNPKTWILPTMILVREYAWALEVGRDFRADVAFPVLRILVEVKGGAHAAGRAKQRADVEREGLAVSLGYRVLPLTPAQAMAEEGVELVLRTRYEALGALIGPLEDRGASRAKEVERA